MSFPYLHDARLRQAKPLNHFNGRSRGDSERLDQLFSPDNLSEKKKYCHCLHIVIINVNVDKLSGQLVETKMVLTTMDAEHLAYQERTNARIKELERDLADKNKILGLVEQRVVQTMHLQNHMNRE